VSFTTWSIKVVDRHHVQLPVVGALRVKQQTEKLQCRLDAGTARILRATIVTEGAKTYVSFSVIARREQPAHEPQGVCGHDVGTSALVVGSVGDVTATPVRVNRSNSEPPATSGVWTASAGPGALPASMTPGSTSPALSLEDPFQACNGQPTAALPCSPEGGQHL